jgi:hypothetical protein
MANAQDFTNDQPLTQAQQQALAVRLKAAWANLPEDKKVALKPLIDKADQEFASYLETGTVPDHKVHSILRMKSYLTDDWEGHRQRFNQLAPAKAIEMKVGPGGEILGTGKYELLDPLWELETGSVWLENLVHKHSFPSGTPTRVQIPDQVTIALAGDFGTGNYGANDSPNTKLSKFIPKLKPDITIHLGDVYYAGTSGEESNKLLNFWPKGSLASFALNSNHDMYSGGGPYFNEVVGGSVFNKFQSPFSFFFLENSNWIIVGLDSAYYSGVLDLYMDGTLGNSAQVPFLRERAHSAHQNKKKVVLLTHHNGLAEDGVLAGAPLRLFTEVMSAFQGLTPPAYWYWGHKHMAVAYKPLADHNGLLCRCLGHAALPWGFASVLQNSQRVQWFEKCNAKDPDSPLRVQNGFVFLQFDGTSLTETFYDEQGRVAWTLTGGDPRNCAP